MTATTEIVRVPFHGTELLTVETNGKPHIVLRPAIEALGLDFSTQRAKLRSRSWAVMGLCPTTGSDGKTYQMVTVDVRTFLMLLATVDENRVAQHLQRLLVAYQSEVADVIEAYWTKGAATRPGAEFEIPQTYPEALRSLADQHEAREAAEHRVAKLQPSAEAWDTLASAGGDFSVREAAYILNRDPGINTGQRRLFTAPRALKVIGPRDIPYAAHESHVRLRPRSYLDRATGEETPAKTQVRITADGLRYLHRQFGGTKALDTANLPGYVRGELEMAPEPANRGLAQRGHRRTSTA
ncbi:MAG: phage antirepressor N-terminal domain-containing protein [Pseudonocardiaceae bacterium]